MKINTKKVCSTKHEYKVKDKVAQLTKMLLSHNVNYSGQRNSSLENS